MQALLAYLLAVLAYGFLYSIRHSLGQSCLYLEQNVTRSSLGIAQSTLAQAQASTGLGHGRYSSRELSAVYVPDRDLSAQY